MDIEIRHTACMAHYELMSTRELRDAFLIDGLFEPDIIKMYHVDLDRLVFGTAVPVAGSITLGSNKDVLGTEYFTERREMGVFNIGSDGIVTVDGEEFSLRNRDTLYIGRGHKDIVFDSVHRDSPAKFYMASYPAHSDYPNAKIALGEYEPLRWGETRTCNKRTLNACINMNTSQACQLTMGCTVLEEGSNWNTFPSHLHPRRSEAYLYFDMPEDALVFHIMGKPDETRHIVVRNEQVVLAPSWSIHPGVGTQAYSFLWAMGGEDRDILTVLPIDNDRLF